MIDIVFKGRNDQVLTNSLLVAEKFEKEHRNVLTVIRDILATEKSAAKFFSETTYNNRGKDYPMYIMNRDGFSLLVMGFTGEKALQFKLEYIEAFNKMEEVIRGGGFQIPQNFSEALRLAAVQAEQMEAQRNHRSAVKINRLCTVLYYRLHCLRGVDYLLPFFCTHEKGTLA